MTRTATVAAPLLLAIALSACESDATLPDPHQTGPVGEMQVDASSNTAFTWIDLGELRTVSPADPANSTGWDLGIRRYEVRLNGGLTGAGDVAAALVVNHADDSPATILEYSAAERLPEFESIDESDIPNDAAFSASMLVADPSSWFTPSGQGLVANPARAWKLRLADGGHAVLRVAELGFTNQELTSFRVEYRLQPGNGPLGAAQELTVVPGVPGSPTRISLAGGSATTESGCAWDLAIDAGLEITLNSAAPCSAGSFPLESGESFEGVSTAADAPQYGPFLATITSPIANSVAAEDAPPFLYGIDPGNQHRLVPTYNIYLIRRGPAVFKVQFLGYYNPVGGASGYPTLRVARIR